MWTRNLGRRTARVNQGRAESECERACSPTRLAPQHAPFVVPTLKSGPGETLRSVPPPRPIVVPTLKSGPGETLRLSAVQCWAHASGVGKRTGERLAPQHAPSLFPL